MLALVVGCGDASGIGSDHWGGIGTGNGPSSDGGSAPMNGADASAPSDAAPPPVESGPQTTAFQVMTDKTSYSVELRSTVTVQVTITPQSFTGSVSLAVSGLPTDTSGMFSPASVNVSGTTAATSTLTLTTLSTVVAGTTPFQITATSGSDTGSAAPMLDVMAQITIEIPSNLAAVTGTSGSPSTDAYGDYPIVMNAATNFGTANPIIVRFLNLNSTPHCIHASNPSEGFPHDPTTNGVCSSPFSQNAYDSTAHNVNTKGSYTFWLHDQGDLTDGMIKIQ